MGRLLTPWNDRYRGDPGRPLPWDDSAAEQHIAWMLRVGAAWWNCFASLAGGPEVNNTSPAKRERHATAKTELGERSG